MALVWTSSIQAQTPFPGGIKCDRPNDAPGSRLYGGRPANSRAQPRSYGRRVANTSWTSPSRWPRVSLRDSSTPTTALKSATLSDSALGQRTKASRRQYQPQFHGDGGTPRFRALGTVATGDTSFACAFLRPDRTCPPHRQVAAQSLTAATSALAWSQSAQPATTRMSTYGKPKGRSPSTRHPIPAMSFWFEHNGTVREGDSQGAFIVSGPMTLVARFSSAKRVNFRTEPAGLRVRIDRAEIRTTDVEPCEPNNYLVPGAPKTVRLPCIGEFDFAPGSRHIIGCHWSRNTAVGQVRQGLGSR